MKGYKVKLDGVKPGEIVVIAKGVQEAHVLFVYQETG